MNRTFTRWTLAALTLACALVAGSALAQNAPIVTRPAPYPNYRVGGPASLIIETSPSQPYAPIYEFRYKNGAPDGPQPELIGYTNGSGRFEFTVASLPAGIEGSYTNERYSVGTPWTPKSSPALSFTIAPATPLGVSCGCEHFGSQYDQICQANPIPSSPPNGGQYRYYFTSVGGGFPYLHNPASPINYVTCESAPLRVDVRTDLVIGGTVIESATTRCLSGTPHCPGGARGR